MTFKIDENLPIELAGELVEAGHEAVTVEDQRLVRDLQVGRSCSSAPESRLRRYTNLSAGKLFWPDRVAPRSPG